MYIAYPLLLAELYLRHHSLLDPPFAAGLLDPGPFFPGADGGTHPDQPSPAL